MTESSTDRTLLTLFIVIAILAVIIYFTRGFGGVAYNNPTVLWRTSGAASAGTSVRAISPVSNTRSSSYSNTSTTYTKTIPGNTTTTTYYTTY